MKPLATLIASAAFTFGVTATAFAQSESYAVRVPYADLNLNVDAGADTFLNRLDRAGRDTCGGSTNRVPMAQSIRIRACAVSFTQNGVVQLNHQHVTQRYLERGGTLPTIDIASM